VAKLFNRAKQEQLTKARTHIQVRIVKATREGRWHKVKALQWLLTHSFSGRALAVKRVTDNKGKRTRGWMVGHGKPRRRRSNRWARFGGAVIDRSRSPCPYPESQWKTETAGNTDDERPGHAGVVSAGPGTRRGNDRRSQLLWFSS
jgi:hypothetical protein